jgi:hypothetical protein
MKLSREAKLVSGLTLLTMPMDVRRDNSTRHPQPVSRARPLVHLLWMKV